MSHIHRFVFSHYEKFISRGVCECGAVTFAADFIYLAKEDNKEIFARVEELNNKEGKPCMVMPTDTALAEDATPPPAAAALNVAHDLYIARARAARDRTCPKCPRFYEFDGSKYCASKVCSSRLSKEVRYQYRPDPGRTIRKKKKDCAGPPPANSIDPLSKYRAIVDYCINGNRLTIEYDLTVLSKEEFDKLWEDIGKHIRDKIMGNKK